jgi:hypothetical protein
LKVRRARRVVVAALFAAGCSTALAAVSAGSPGAGTAVTGAQALDVVGRCVARLDPQTDVGYDRIAARCPDLASQLDRAPWSAWLPADWRTSGNDLSVASLRDLRSLIPRELQTRTGVEAPQVASLQPILRRLDLQEETQGSWSRFKEWVRDVFTPHEQNPREGWLSRVLGAVNVSDAVARLISWISLSVTIVLAMAIVANELRVAGLFARRRSSRQAHSRSAPTLPPQSIGWEDVQRAVPGERPRLLLQLIATRLVALGGLPPAEALTVRELVRVARLPNSGDRELLVDIALAAERLRFSGDQVCADSIELALAHGRTLLEHLEARA